MAAMACPVLDRDAARQRIKSLTFLAGQFSPNDSANVHPTKLAVELARHAQAIGVEFHEGSPVKNMKANGADRTQLL